MECCIYCGDWWQCRDHVIPVSYTSAKRYYNRNDTVQCCHECNHLLGDRAYHTIPDRASYLIRAYRYRARKYLDSPDWTPIELESMGYTLRTHIESKLEVKRLYQSKLQNLARVANGFDAEIIHFALSTRDIEKGDNPHTHGKEIICPVCEVIFVSSNKARIYCSKECNIESNRIRTRERAREKVKQKEQTEVLETSHCEKCDRSLRHYPSNVTVCVRCVI